MREESEREGKGEGLRALERCIGKDGQDWDSVLSMEAITGRVGWRWELEEWVRAVAGLVSDSEPGFKVSPG